MKSLSLCVVSLIAACSLGVAVWADDEGETASPADGILERDSRLIGGKLLWDSIEEFPREPFVEFQRIEWGDWKVEFSAEERLMFGKALESGSLTQLNALFRQNDMKERFRKAAAHFADVANELELQQMTEALANKTAGLRRPKEQRETNAQKALDNVQNALRKLAAEHKGTDAGEKASKMLRKLEP